MPSMLGVTSESSASWKTRAFLVYSNSIASISPRILSESDLLLFGAFVGCCSGI